MSTGVAVRAARPHDAGRLAELLTELGYPVGGDEVRDRLAYWLPDPASHVLVAERGGRLAGCISVHAIPFLERTGRWLRIDSLVVDADQRRTGTGRALLAAAERLARDWGCLRIEVTSRRSRADAHAFYRSQGFIDVCDRSARFTKELDVRGHLPLSAPSAQHLPRSGLIRIGLRVDRARARYPNRGKLHSRRSTVCVPGVSSGLCARPGTLTPWPLPP